jgi:recombination endonuclease VII
MPRARTTCARKPGHSGDCRTTDSLADNYKRLTARRVGTRLRDDPAARARWNRKYRLSQYGLSPERFAELLEAQGYACAMGGEPFEDGAPVCIDHDHGCCPDEKRSCGRCVRGLLCVSCNTALGIIERKYAVARAYLDSRPRPPEPPLVQADPVLAV